MRGKQVVGRCTYIDTEDRVTIASHGELHNGGNDLLQATKCDLMLRCYVFCSQAGREFSCNQRCETPLCHCARQLWTENVCTCYLLQVCALIMFSCSRLFQQSARERNDQRGSGCCSSPRDPPRPVQSLRPHKFRQFHLSSVEFKSQSLLTAYFYAPGATH